MKTEHKIIGGVVLLTLIIIIGGTWLSSKKGNENRQRLSRLQMGEKITEMKSPHVTREESHSPYNSNPPTSGPHIGNGVAGPGIKTKPVSDELVLHSMEHGAAVVWYKDDLAQNDIDKIKEAFNSAS